jgi:proteic killer suppression protein
VQIVFRHKKLSDCFMQHQRGVREWGPEVARKYIHRIQIIQAAKSRLDLNSFPGLNCHPLKGKRQGQYAISLTQSWRLIISLQGDQMEIVRIEEVSHHYD